MNKMKRKVRKTKKAKLHLKKKVEEEIIVEPEEYTEVTEGSEELEDREESLCEKMSRKWYEDD